LPVLLIDDWAEVQEMTEDQLSEIYRTIESRFSMEFASADYWTDMVRTMK